MTKYREILRLISNKLTTSDIVAACGVSKKTVVKVKKRAAELDISWPLSADMTDEKLEAIMFPKPEKPASTKRMPNFDYIWKELLRNGVNTAHPQMATGKPRESTGISSALPPTLPPSMNTDKKLYNQP